MIRALHFFSTRKLFCGLMLLGLVLGVTLLTKTQTAHAAYDGGLLISDSVFLDAGSLTKQEVQDFLASKGSGLATRNFLLDCYGQTSKERQWYTAVGAPCDQTVPASQIIYYAAQIYGINPQVVLSTLQKEQSLITSPNPTSWQLDHAMGYGCPTTSGCSASNFFYQIDSGVWVLRYHYERARGNMTWWSTSTTWTCGTEKSFYKPNLYPNQDVRFYDEDNVYYRTHYIGSAATSSMYCYTPHAYNNPQGLYGLPAYGTTGRYYTGSYNFVKYFELWFGPTVREKVIAVSFDANTDNSGEMATIGFRLSSKPSANVTVPLRISTPENARIMSGLTAVIITPENWNNPKMNKVYIAGLNNPSQVGTIYYKLDLQRPNSADPYYSNLPPSNYSDVFLTHQDTLHPPSVFRVYDSTSQRNIFTANVTEKNALVAGGWEDKGIAFSYCEAGENTVFRLRKGNERLLIADNNTLYPELLADGFELENVNFAASPQGSVPIYWFHNSTTLDNYYKTTTTAMAGYTNMGVAFNSCAPEVTPVSRLYNRATRSYLFTASSQERKMAIATGTFSKYEGVGFYACDTGTSLYRLYRPNTNSYAFVTSTTDRDYLVANNRFVNQGIEYKLCADGNRDVFGLYDSSIGVHFYTTSTHERDDFIDNVGYKTHGVLFEAK